MQTVHGSTVQLFKEWLSQSFQHLNRSAGLFIHEIHATSSARAHSTNEETEAQIRRKPLWESINTYLHSTSSRVKNKELMLNKLLTST